MMSDVSKRWSFKTTCECVICLVGLWGEKELGSGEM